MFVAMLDFPHACQHERLGWEVQLNLSMSLC